MKFIKWASGAIAGVVLATTLLTATIQAEGTRTIADESIYDVLVDRFLNGTTTNDLQVNTEDETKFAGGDFIGLQSKIDFIKKMGFTQISIGSVFATETYDGQMPTSYEAIEAHFGTADELKSVIDIFHNANIGVIVDFPITNVSVNHEWAKDATKRDWVQSVNQNKVQWDLSNTAVQQALQEAVGAFVQTYDVAGIRLTNTTGVDAAFLNDIIATVKEQKDHIYVISNEESDADFDAHFYHEVNEVYRTMFKSVDLDSSNFTKYVESFEGGQDEPTQIMFDSLQTDRFTYDVVEEGMFPPTRLKMALAPALLLPGVPVIQYGSEIAMNGEAGAEAHQYYNFKTDEELIDFIANLQELRNKSETLRNGDFDIIHNENGLLAFTRTSTDEEWFVMVNNTSKTKRIDLKPDQIGEDKELHGLLNGEIVRLTKENVYPVIQDRETVEVYQIIDEKGINISYVLALGFVYVLFIGFIVMIIKRGKKNRASEK